MTMPKATSICGSILNLMYRAFSWPNVADNAAASPLTLVYLGLHTGNLNAATGLQNENETAYTNYIRKSVARNTTEWTAPSGGAISNVNVQQFAQCGASGSTVTHVSTGIGASGATASWHFGALNSSLAIANGITPQFNAGGLVITES
jgi:hypothetical protein